VSPTEPVVLRRALPADLPAVADLYLRVRHENVATIPPLVHDEAAVRTWVTTVLPQRDEIWVAVLDDQIVGLLAVSPPDWIDHLYVEAGCTGRGIGAALVDVASRELGDRLQLWTFASNTGARRFYERLGFVAVESTEGDNEEHAPDIRYLRRLDE
jgi:ribosomal protein S18 acetylase RimI-like enzyme